MRGLSQNIGNTNKLRTTVKRCNLTSPTIKNRVQIQFCPAKEWINKVQSVLLDAPYTHVRLILPGYDNNKPYDVVQLTWDGFEHCSCDSVDIESYYPTYEGTTTFSFLTDDEGLKFMRAKVHVLSQLGLRWTWWYCVAAVFNFGEFPSLTCSSTVSWIVFNRLLGCPMEFYNYLNTEFDAWEVLTSE